MGKICRKCNVEKELSEFGVSRRFEDGLNRICKSCKHEIDNAWNAKHRDYRKKSSKQWREENPNKVAAQYQKRKEFLMSLKTPCVKCGESRPTVIEFHHIDPTTKLFNLAYAVSNGSKPVPQIYAELEKCVCLCANCHAEFHERYGHTPETPVEMLNEYLSL